MTLTDSQRRGVEAFRAFLAGGEQVFLLKGAAGTGKTTLVAEFIRLLDACHRSVSLMAPTGRAAYIIGSKVGRSASTIHKAIYGLSNLKPTGRGDEDETDGVFQFSFGLRGNEDTSDTVYIVDESSMISNSYSENEAFSFGSGYLLADLFEYAGGRKIVFVGDHAQLPPIGMNFSPALDKEYLEREFHCVATEVVLREVMRQSGGGVMLKNAGRIRDSIEKKSFVEFKLVGGADSQAENEDLLRPYFQLSPSKPAVKAVVIAYSNRQVSDYNRAIRRHYYGGDAPRLKAGELLMICRNNYSFEYELFNGNIVQVAACQADDEVIRRHVRVKMGKNHIEPVALTFRKAAIRFMANGKPVSLSVMLLDNFLDDASGAVGGLLSRALIVDFNNRLPEHIRKRRSEIERLLKSKRKLTDEESRLCEVYRKLLADDPYYNAVICKYGYALTCHKAQGGEWENVFVDMCRYGGTANEDYFRWAYTALTRASKKVWHFHSPEFDYISSLVVEEITPSSNIRVSNYSGDEDFRDARFRRISGRAKELGLTAMEERGVQYQHLITFVDGNSDVVTFRLWYNARGYRDGYSVVSASSEELSSLCAAVIESSYAPEYVPFEAPDRPFAEKLVSYMRSLLAETGIQLLDISRENYQDVFHLKTEGIAKIGLAYNAAGRYTYMRLTSSLGREDKKLQNLRKLFI